MPRRHFPVRLQLSERLAHDDPCKLAVIDDENRSHVALAVKIVSWAWHPSPGAPPLANAHSRARSSATIQGATPAKVCTAAALIAANVRLFPAGTWPAPHRLKRRRPTSIDVGELPYCDETTFPRRVESPRGAMPNCSGPSTRSSVSFTLFHGPALNHVEPQGMKRYRRQTATVTPKVCTEARTNL